RVHVSLARGGRGPSPERRRPSRAARQRPWPSAGGRRHRRGGARRLLGRLSGGAGRQRRRSPALSHARLPRPRCPPRLLRPRAGRDRDGATARPAVSEAGGLDASVTIGVVRLPNPVIAAAGAFGYGTELAGLVDLAALGAVGVKGLSLAP